MVNFILKDSIYKLELNHYPQSGKDRAMFKMTTTKRLAPGDVVVYGDIAFIIDWTFDNGKDGHASMIDIQTARDIWQAIYQKKKLSKQS